MTEDPNLGNNPTLIAEMAKVAAKIDDPLRDICDGLDWLRDHVTPAQVKLNLAKDGAIRTALQEVQPAWSDAEIRRRCVLVRSVYGEGETLFVDGRAAVVFEPVEVTQEWKDDRLIVTSTQKFRRVQAAKVANDG